MKNLKALFLFLLMFGTFAFASAPHAFAFNQFEPVCDGTDGTSQSTVCEEKAKTQSPDSAKDIINKVATIMTIVAGIMAVVYIMIAGLGMITSTGDSAKVAKTRDSIIYVAAGIVVIILARSIIVFILNRL